jgi:hypothetical protein
MPRLFNFVAFILVAIIAVPVFASNYCPEHSESGMHCPPGCSMMAMAQTTAEMQFKAATPKASCCELSSSKPAPRTQLQPPTDTTAISRQAISAVVGMAPVERRSEHAIPLPLSDSGGAQSLLCTFLI